MKFKFKKPIFCRITFSKKPIPKIVSIGYAGKLLKKICKKKKFCDKNHFHEKLSQRSYQGDYTGAITRDVFQNIKTYFL